MSDERFKLVANTLIDVQQDARKGASKALDERGGQHVDHRDRQAERRSSRWRATLGSYILAQVADLANEGKRALMQDAARLGKLHAARQPREELRPQLALEQCNVSAHPRLNHAQVLGGARDAAKLRDLLKMGQRPNIHRLLPETHTKRGMPPIIELLFLTT